VKKTIFFVFGTFVLIAGSLVSCVTTNNSATAQTVTPREEHFTNDRRFDGTWQTPDSEIVFVFYSDTYQLIKDGEVMVSGVFNFTDNQLDCQVAPGLHFVLGYTFAENLISIVSVLAVPDSLIGQWNKVDVAETEAPNPLVGTWKCKTDTNYVIYQFYADGTGKDYDCNPSLTNMNLVGEVSYNIEDFSFVEYLYDGGSSPVVIVRGTLKLNGDELTIGDFVLTRQ
jgi:hypothetical protein